MRNGMSKTAFLVFAALIAFGILGTIALAIVTSKPVGIFITGGLIFGILTGILMAVLADKDYKLDDDFKLTVVRVKKYTLPAGVSEDDIIVDDDEIYVDDDEDFSEIK